MKKVFPIITILVAGVLSGCGGSNNHNKIEASGTIEATNVTVSSKVSGQVLKLNFREGDLVKVGDTLMTIDHDNLSIQLQQAVAGEEQSVAQLQLMKEGARSEDIKQAEDAVKQAKANYDLAKQDRERNEKLFRSKSITQQQFDNIISRYDIASAQLNSSQENLKKMKNFYRPDDIKQAEANVNRQKASVDLLKKYISDSYVTAPISGFIVKKFVEAGESVVPLSSLVMLSNLSYVDLDIYVSEEELGSVKLGQKADVSIDAFKNKVYPGKVIYISPEAEFTPKNIQTKDERTKLVFKVKVHVPNPNFELKDGMPADAIIYTK
ncbi:MAG TPA: efflux RND transporter periplasmic adaptor subunit [Ignavibacteriaceae bacterium]|nr:efflux RND transporter periplasmic adaptor subunit [Ignavibacteriaceae bacterium]